MTEDSGAAPNPIAGLRAKLDKADRYGPSRLISIFPMDNSDGTMDLIYMFQHNEEVVQYRYKVNADAELDSISDLYKGAWNMEREAIDMFGIHFKGVPGGLLIMPETGIRTPLRKLTTNDDKKVIDEVKKDV